MSDVQRFRFSVRASGRTYELRIAPTYPIGRESPARTVFIVAEEFGGKDRRAHSAEVFALASEIEGMLPASLTCEVSSRHGTIEIRCEHAHEAHAARRAIGLAPSVDRTVNSPLRRMP